MSSTRSLGVEILHVVTAEYMETAENMTADAIATQLKTPLAEVLECLQIVPFGIEVDVTGRIITYGPTRNQIRSELRIADRQTARARADLGDANEEIERLREENQSLRSAAGDSIRGRIDLGMRP